MNDQTPTSPEAGIKDSNELEFAVFCMENLAVKLGVTAPQVYRALTGSSSILKTYIIPGYDILHTQGKDYIMNGILDTLNGAGVSV